MHQRNVQQWASTLRQSLRNHSQPSNINDASVGSENGVRNVSTTIKTRENKAPNDQSQYSFTLNLKPPKKDFNRTLKPQFYTFDMTTKDEQKHHSASDAPISSIDQPDIDVLSDAGTYIIEDDIDRTHDYKSEQKTNSSSLLKRYVDQTRNRHGTFDIHGIIPTTTHTINRPVVDINTPTQDLCSSFSSSSSSCSSSLLSFPVDNDLSIFKDSELAFQRKLANNFTCPSDMLIQQPFTVPPPLPNSIKPPECFVIPSKSGTNTSSGKIEAPWKTKLAARPVRTTDSSVEIPTTQSITPPPVNQIPSVQLRKQPTSIKSSIRPRSAIMDQTNLSSFHRQPAPGNTQSHTSLTATHNNNTNQKTSNLTKIYVEKPAALRRPQSNVFTSPSKPTSSLKPTNSIPSTPGSVTNSNLQTNRAVELRRARAQAKIEELSQRTKKQLPKSTQQSDIMSASWHSNASSIPKTTSANLHSNPRTRPRITTVRQDLMTTRTISSSSNNRSTSASPNRLNENSPSYRKTAMPNTTHSQRSHRLSATNSSIGGERYDSLRDNGQRIAIKLIQLSSGILEKLKPNDTTIVDDDTSIRELEQLIDQLQSVKQTLSLIDASLSSPSIGTTYV